MGCGGSKEKKKKEAPTPKEKSVQKQPTPKASTKDAKESTVKEEVERDTAAGAAEPEEEAVAEEVTDHKGERQAAIEEERAKQLNQFSSCTVTDGEVTALFANGSVYRIIKDGKWYLYNDTQNYEAHVDYRFAPGSDVAASVGWMTILEHTDDGWTRASAVVYPLQTQPFVFGKFTEFKSSINLVPLSDAFRAKDAAPAIAVANKETEAVRQVADGEEDEEAILRKCLDSNTPFVDLHFPPTEMFARPEVDVRHFPLIAVQRPSQYLPADKQQDEDVVRGTVIPQSLEHGHLGDSWLTSSAAVIAEDEVAVKAIFSHCAPEEKKIGAYRVTVSKQGWWRSLIVDNYLPTVSKKPLFARLYDDPCDIWVSLFQKAYAKLHGSYASITGGDGLQLLQDFTGAPSYRFDKEWEEAVKDAEKAEAFTAKLTGYSEKQYLVVLNTPGHDSTSYLGARYADDYESFKSKYEKVGLRLGCTYYVDAIEGSGNTCYFKIRNPWESSTKLVGHWEDADADEVIKEACEKAAKDNFIWVSWNQAADFFDGGGVVYFQKHSKPVDYRVKGTFAGTYPSAVLEITVTEPVTATLVLSQPDKRGASATDHFVRYAPILLSVARRTDDGRQRVDKNSGWDVENPSAEYNFVVARDVALTYTFTPENGPYYVVPRIHRTGVAEGYDRPYTVGVIAESPLDGKASIHVKQIEEDRPRVQKHHHVRRERCHRCGGGDSDPPRL
ncbi:cysteine peptidase, Clan CA, family C2 [Angomonas deanei]|nr:cysteine peptidase, Clan CA, family C2 [Angomonas deanei]|eukprot:EPY29841.1 cysteine peptidase, Clan CA, family C2 [Angomonas deanei]